MVGLTLVVGIIMATIAQNFRRLARLPKSAEINGDTSG
jgi:hypothetical protein